MPHTQQTKTKVKIKIKAKTKTATIELLKGSILLPKPDHFFKPIRLLDQIRPKSNQSKQKKSPFAQIQSQHKVMNQNKFI
jgi:hypothetical protein